MLRIAVILIFLLSCSGCLVGPDYERPATEVPAGWHITVPEARDLSNVAWWEQFQDPVLTGFVVEALRNNQDLLIATARIDEFMGRYGVSRADLYPQLGAEGKAGRERLSEAGTPAGIDNPDNFYQAFLTGSWEIDLWGKLRRASQAARADLLSTEEARQTVILTLVSAVAEGYINLLSLDRQLEIAQNTRKTRKESLDIFELRHDAGLISKLELSQVRSEYHDARALVPVLQKRIAQQEHALNVLMGRNPGPIARGGTVDDLQLFPIPSGLPSELLARRPDIRQAEHDLIAANARIGVARAAYYPTVSLTGFLGTASKDLSDLFSGDSKAWNYSAPVTVPIFTAGRIESQVKAAQAVRQQALYRYQQVIQNAFREVEDALVADSRNREQLDGQRQQVAALTDYASLARLRYDEGYSSYIEVLDAERSLLTVQLNYTQTKADVFIALVTLYRSMGGGWLEIADEIAH